MHAKCKAHSLLLIHSGLQFGGEPRNPGRQEHDGVSAKARHSALAPQGDGEHGCVRTTGSDADRKRNYYQKE